MLYSICYFAFRQILQMLALCVRSNDFKGVGDTRWGYQRIVGELKGLGVSVSPTTVPTWLRDAGLGLSGPDAG